MMKTIKARIIAITITTLVSGVLCAFPEKPVFPEIQLSGGLSSIPNNSTSPDELAGTHFGEVDVATTPRIHTFQVHNLGEGDLLLSPTLTISGANAAEFYVQTQPSLLTIPEGGQTSFQIAYSPSFSGSHFATVELINNDEDEGIYQFDIQGSMSGSPLRRQADIQAIWVGYGTYKALGYPQFTAKVTGGIGFLNVGNKFMNGCRFNVYVSNVPFLDETAVRVFSRVYDKKLDYPRPFGFGNYGILPFGTIVPVNRQYLIGEILTSEATGEFDKSNNRFMYKFVRNQ